MFQRLMSWDFSLHSTTTTLHESQLKISVVHVYNIYINMTSYLIIATILKIETMSNTVHSPFLKMLIDLGVVGVSMIDEQFVMLEAVNWIDQNFQWLQSMVHLSVQSPLERSQVTCAHSPLSL